MLLSVLLWCAGPSSFSIPAPISYSIEIHIDLHQHNEPFAEDKLPHLRRRCV
jgi:hypothetical protein